MAVFVWGLGKNGQIGNGLKENAEIPQRIGLRHVGSERRGRETVCKGQVSQSTAKDVGSPGMCMAIGAGGLYTAALTEAGQVYCWGSGTHGRLGSGNEEDSSRPQLIPISKGIRITKVSCGVWHGAAVTDQGKLYVWGYSKGHGVLGLEHRGPYAPPLLLTPLDHIQVAGVTCGNNYTLAWGTEGEVFSWGCGRHGVLGHGDEEDRLIPTRVPTPEAIVQAEAGFTHVGLVSVEGHIFMMGNASTGALGCGQKRLKLSPSPLQANTPEGVKFTEVSCSKGEHHGHTLALTSEGQVFSWGDGYKGKLGLGDQESHHEPTPIPKDSFDGQSVVHVSAGGIHSAAVTTQGRVYTWGCGSDGRLGHPEVKGHRYLFRSDVPRLVEELVRHGHVADVKASYYHTVALLTNT